MNKSYELSMPDTDISFVSNGRPSVERIYPSLYDNLDSGMTPRLSTTSEFDIRSFGTSLSGNKSIHILSPQFDYSSSSHSSGSHESGAAWGSQNMVREIRQGKGHSFYINKSKHPILSKI
jgi:hypothetical protein